MCVKYIPLWLSENARSLLAWTLSDFDSLEEARSDISPNCFAIKVVHKRSEHLAIYKLFQSCTIAKRIFIGCLRGLYVDNPNAWFGGDIFQSRSRGCTYQERFFKQEHYVRTYHAFRCAEQFVSARKFTAESSTGTNRGSFSRGRACIRREYLILNTAVKHARSSTERGQPLPNKSSVNRPGKEEASRKRNCPWKSHREALCSRSIHSSPFSWLLLFIVDPFKYWHNRRHRRVRHTFIKRFCRRRTKMFLHCRASVKLVNRPPLNHP